MLLSSTSTSDCKPPIRAFQSPRREMIQTPHFIHSLAFSPVEQWAWTQKKQLLRSFYVMWTQQKKPQRVQTEQLVLLLFICSKSGKSKPTRRMVILRFEMQNLKEQFTPNSRLHVFPHPVFLDCVGVCSPLFLILFFLIMKCTVVLEAPENTPGNLFAEVTPCFSWSPQTLLWAVSCGNYFLSTKLQPSNSLLGQTSTYPCWDGM